MKLFEDHCKDLSLLDLLRILERYLLCLQVSIEGRMRSPKILTILQGFLLGNMQTLFSITYMCGKFVYGYLFIVKYPIYRSTLGPGNDTKQ